MQQYLDSNIKDLLAAHPPLGPVLEAGGIGCTTCSLGSCRIKDILEIHNLDTAATRNLLQQMGAILYQGRPFEAPALERQALPTKASFCPPIARMVHEHTHIMRFIGLIPSLTELLRQDPGAAFELLAEGLIFIRTYADSYHHAKEEDILFGFFDASDLLGAMGQDHTQGRAHVAAMAEGLARKDADQVATRLQAYGELLRGHIHREDTILYPWMDRTLTTRQVGELYARCAEAEARFGEEPRRQEAFVTGLATFLQA
jgi:hemerythrin-like domain-containing protein